MPFSGTLKSSTSQYDNGGSVKTVTTASSTASGDVTWSSTTEGAPFNNIGSNVFAYYDTANYPAANGDRVKLECSSLSSSGGYLYGTMVSKYNPFIMTSSTKYTYFSNSDKVLTAWKSAGSTGNGLNIKPAIVSGTREYGSGEGKFQLRYSVLPDCVRYANARINEVYTAMGNKPGDYTSGAAGSWINCPIYWYNHRSELTGDYKFHLKSEKVTPIPGSILIWNGSSYSHIAFVEARFKDSSGNWVIYYSESASSNNSQHMLEYMKNPVWFIKTTMKSDGTINSDFSDENFIGWVETPVSKNVNTAMSLSVSCGNLTTPTLEEQTVYANLIKENPDSSFPVGTKVRVQERCAATKNTQGYNVNINGTICYIGNVYNDCYFPYELVDNMTDKKVLAYANRAAITKTISTKE